MFLKYGWNDEDPIGASPPPPLPPAADNPWDFGAPGGLLGHLAICLSNSVFL